MPLLLVLVISRETAKEQFVLCLFFLLCVGEENTKPSQEGKEKLQAFGEKLNVRWVRGRGIV